MTRSALPVFRLFLVPYAALLGLYLLVVGGGSAWLLMEARQAEAELVAQRLLRTVAPLAARLSGQDAIALLSQPDSWLSRRLEALRGTLPALREISIRGPHRGYGVSLIDHGAIKGHELGPLDGTELPRDERHPAGERLRTQPGPRFHIGFDLARPGASPLRLDFGFSRDALLAQITDATATLIRAIALFSVAGGLSLLIAFGLSLYVGRMTRRIEAHFQEIYRRAASAELAAALVHDLRNPLASLRANIKALLITPEQLSEITEELDQDLMRLDAKLSAFLDLSRRQDEDFETTDLERLLRDTARVASPVLSRHGLQLDLRVAHPLPPVRLMPQGIRDAVLNLLINAAQSGQQTGTIHLGAQVHGDGVEIRVEDRGGGIPPGARPYIYRPFYTTKPEGHGLGLATVQRVVSLHHGRIRAEPREGGGTRFILSLPIRHKEPPPWWKKRRHASRT